MSLLLESVVSSLSTVKDSTISISCSDVTENTYVLLLDWKCRGQCSGNGKETLAKFTRGRGVTRQRDPRFTIDQDSFDLIITSVRMEDAGEYYCLVNNKDNADDKIQLTVLGELISLMNIIDLLPLAPSAPPSRPLVTGFTSRTVDISWTKPQIRKNSPDEILGYIITTRYLIEK